MSARTPRRSRCLPAACLALTLAATPAAAKRDMPETLFPVAPASMTQAGSAPEPGTPPVLRVRPLIELRWAEIFSERLVESGDAADERATPPAVRLPTGPMYRRDI